MNLKFLILLNWSLTFSKYKAYPINIEESMHEYTCLYVSHFTRIKFDMNRHEQKFLKIIKGKVMLLSRRLSSVVY